MYRPQGLFGSELGDVDVIEHDDELHLFHLTLPNHDTVEHLVSSDGIEWRSLPTALRTGDPGAFDDHMIWTTGIVRTDHGFAMLYTALSSKQGGRVQRVGMATSTDLVTWTKAEGPVAEADPRWYDSELHGARWVSWRDPKPVRIAGGYIAPVCARANEGPTLGRGVVGLLESRDARTWTPGPPVLSSHGFYELECPQIVDIGDHFYLIASIQDDHSVRYWRGDSARGPFSTTGGERLVPAGHYAPRVCRFRGDDLLFCWRRCRDGRGRYVPSPLSIQAEGDQLIVAPYDGPWRRRTVDAKQIAVEASGEAWSESTIDSDISSFWLAGELSAEPGPCGFLLGADGAGGGVRVQVGHATARVTAKRQATASDGHPWFDAQVLGECPIPPVARRRIRLQRVGAELELAIDGRVVLSLDLGSSETNERGLALYAEGGRAELSSAELGRLRAT